MKKYSPRSTRWLMIATLIGVSVLLTGIILLFINAQDLSLTVSAITAGGFMSILFFTCFLASKSRILIISEEEIIFPQGADINGKTVLQKTVVKTSEIHSIKSRFFKGDNLISGDCFFHTLKLKNGTQITVTLFDYGKTAEQEIIEAIKKSIRK
ncbi:MAG: hypothetical protein J6M34_00170 [Clostridia bacterium]|nr:hypothetical protein [Clostridia bacterium]